MAIQQHVICNKKIFKALFCIFKNIAEYLQLTIVVMLDLFSTHQELSSDALHVMIHLGHQLLKVSCAQKPS